MNDFTWFSRKANFIDKQVPQSTIDRHFIAANVELMGSNQENNPDKELNRFEFFEVLVRIANDKYQVYGTQTNFTDALDEFMKKNFIPYSNLQDL